MKRNPLIVITMILFCVALVSCNYTNPPTNMESQEQKESISTDSQIDNSEEGGESNNPNAFVTIERPPNRYIYDFDSYEDIKNALKTKNDNNYQILRAEQNNYGNIYSNTLSAFASGNIKIGIPQLDGIDVPLKNADGFSNVMLMTSELYKLPWLYYRCIVGNNDLVIGVSYLSVLGSAEINSASSYYDVLSLIAPDAPSPNNYQQYDSYKKIYEKNLVMADGRSVSAMISELDDSSKVYVMIYRDSMLITLYADHQIFSDAFWNSFTVIEY